MSTLQTFADCTLYLKSEFMGNILRYDVREVMIEEGVKYAQYDQATKVTFIRKGKRRKQGTYITSYPFLIVVRREDAIDPASMLGAGQESTPGMIVSQSRYAAFDDRWVSDFQATLAAKNVQPLYENVSNEKGYRS